MSIFKPEQILANPEKLSWSKVKQNKYGGNIVYIRFNDEPLYVQTPEMYHPYGVSTEDAKDKDGNITGRKYSLSHSFGRKDENSGQSPNQLKLENLHKLLELLDKLTIETALKNCSEWLKLDPEDVDLKSVKLLYNGLVKKSKDKETRKPDGKWPDTFRSKVIYYENDPDPFKTKVFNKQKESQELLTALKKGSRGKSIVDIPSVSFYAGKFSNSVRLRQVQVDDVVGGMSDAFAFIDDSDEEGVPVAKNSQFVESSGDEEEDTPASAPAPAQPNQQTELDDESEEESEEEEPPPPVQPVKKRVVKRTKKADK